MNLPVSIRTLSVFLALIGTLLSLPAAASTALLISGVEGELAQNIRLLVSQPPDKTEERQFRRYLDELPDQTITALSAFGYYGAQVNVRVEDVTPESASIVDQTVDTLENAFKNTLDDDEQETPATTRILIDVTPNDPVLIDSVELQVNTLDAQSTDFNDVLSEVRGQLAQGAVFVSGEYEAAKSAILNTAQELGYFDFEYSSTQVRVSRRAKTATIKLIANAGERFTFGDILFQQRTFTKTFMNRWLPFSTDDPYQAEKIGELTQNLQSSGYFASVRVRPLIDPRYGQTVPVVVDLTEQEQNQVAIGVGYSTDTKFRTTLSWSKPLLNSRGHSAQWDLSLARDTQTTSFSYRIPRDKNPLFNYWGIEYGLKNDIDGDVDFFLSTLNLQRVKRTSRNWNESLFIRWERERFDIGEGENVEEQTTDLVMPGISYFRSRSKGQPFTTWGQATSFQLMGGSKRLLSTIDFVKALGKFRYLRAVSFRNTLIASVQYGVIYSNDYDRVPASQRFFAGGDNTVRGFAFEEISPRNPEGDAIGGRYLEVLSLEYDYRFRDLWSAALFTDAGRAFNDFDTGYSVGAGFGVRWQSPVGPFRIDLATPVSDNESRTVRIHLSLGADF